METPCVVCEEVCPVSPKAIETYDEVITRVDGTKVTLNKPFIIPERCIGCGICEKECPVLDERAVYVTAVGETRFHNQSDRRLLLNDKVKQAAIDLPGEERVSLNASLLSGAALLAKPNSKPTKKSGGCSSGGCSSGSCGTSKSTNTNITTNTTTTSNTTTPAKQGGCSSGGCSTGGCGTSKPSSLVQLAPKANKTQTTTNQAKPYRQAKPSGLRQFISSLGAALQSSGGGCGGGCGCSSNGCGTKEVEAPKTLPKSLPVPIVPINFLQSIEKPVKLETQLTPKSLSMHEDFDLVAWVRDLNEKNTESKL